MSEIKVTTPGKNRRLIIAGGAVAGVIAGFVHRLFALLGNVVHG